MKALPDLIVRDIYELEPGYFVRRGIRLLVLDVDNTLSPYGVDRASPRLLEWAGRFRTAGLTLYILSNNRGERPALFARALGCGFVGRARKPRTNGLRRILRRFGFAPEQAAVIGDQVYADVRCARRCGCMAVLVRPIRMRNPLLAIRYALETPWRAAYWRRKRRNGSDTGNEN